MTLFKQLLLVSAFALAPQAGATDHQPSLLKSCEEANVRLVDLAIGADGRGVRSFYEGEVLVLQIDQGEPAALSFGLAVLMIDRTSEVIGRKCLAATFFNYVDIDAAKSSYAPETGVTLVIPTSDYDGAQSVPGKPLVLTINAGTSKVTASR